MTFDNIRLQFAILGLEHATDTQEVNTNFLRRKYAAKVSSDWRADMQPDDIFAILRGPLWSFGQSSPGSKTCI